MRSWSIRFRITLWFTVALLAVVFVTYFIVLSVNRQVIQKIIRDNLIETVESNVDEIEFYNNIDHVDLHTETDFFLAFGGGYLEIDDDFLDEVNEVYTALYDTQATLLYGENPVARQVAGLGFADSKIQRVTVNRTLYYIFDRKLTLEGLQGLWLRGVVSEQQGMVQMSDVTHLSLLLLPVLVLVSAVGGYLLAKRMLRPIQKISASASQIVTGDDLKKRIEIGRGNDELHQLAASFNAMFQRLEESFEAEHQFTSDASHELRTPVTVIISQCELSLEKQQSVAEYEKALRTIGRQGRKMSKLINDMLDFTRLERRADIYPCETVGLAGLVGAVCEDFALIQEKGITLAWESEGEPAIYGNRQLLSRLLANLISNAYRYGREGGHIWVRLSSEAGQITLSVVDDGIGIAKDEQDKVFRRFYQADKSHSGSGTGLGLSMAYGIAHFHGGDITIESELGKGSTFTFTASEALPEEAGEEDAADGT